MRCSGHNLGSSARLSVGIPLTQHPCRAAAKSAAEEAYKNEQEGVHSVVGAVVNIIAHGLRALDEEGGGPAVWDVLQGLEHRLPSLAYSLSLVQSLPHVTSSLGRARAFLRMMVSEKALDTILTELSQASVPRQDTMLRTLSGTRDPRTLNSWGAHHPRAAVRDPQNHPHRPRPQTPNPDIPQPTPRIPNR